MDARPVIILILLLAAVAPAPPLASAQLDKEFYKTSCPKAEQIIADIIEKRFKKDPAIAGNLLRLVFHDCFANGCDASILIDPLSNTAAEKEAGPNISVRGYDVIEEIKTELEKACPETVSCADIVTVTARDVVKLAGGPEYEVPLGRRDSLESNREDADRLPGPDIPVPKLLDEFSKQGFTLDETIAMIGGGHAIGSCRCFFIETDAAPIDPDYNKNITATCDGKDAASVPMDPASPNTFDGSYFALALAKKMPLTIDRLLGMDPKTEPVLKFMETNPDKFVPLFAKSMEKLSVLKVLTGKEGEIRKACSEFNNAPAQDGGSIIRISSVNADQLGAAGVPEPGAKPAVAEARKVAPGGERSEAKIAKTLANEAASKIEGGTVIDAAEVNKENKLVADGNKVLGDEPASKLPGSGEGTKLRRGAEPVPVPVEANKMVAAGNKVLGDEPASKLPGGEDPKRGRGAEPVPVAEEASKPAPKLRGTPQ